MPHHVMKNSGCQHLLCGHFAVLHRVLLEAGTCLLGRVAFNVGLRRPLTSCSTANTTHQVLDGGPHFLVFIRVDDRVHDRVEDGEEE